MEIHDELANPICARRGGVRARGLFDTAQSPAPANTLVVARASAAPTLDGNANDPAWATAAPLKVQLSGGMNFTKGETTVTLKSVVVGDTIYFLMQYDDPTNSVLSRAVPEAGRWFMEEAEGPEGRRRR